MIYGYSFLSEYRPTTCSEENYPIRWVSSLVWKKIDWLIGTVLPQYPRVMRSKTYRGYVKPRIVPNAMYNVMFV
jgi:hypothetical protein